MAVCYPKCAWCSTECPQDVLDSNDSLCTTCSRVTRCPNFLVCDAACPQWALDCHGGRCHDCTVQLGPLTFREASSADDPCPVCLEAAPWRVQMTCEGKHDVCVACFRTPWKREPGPQPEAFGCPCASDEEDEDDVIEQWSETHPTQYRRWGDACDRDEARGDEQRAGAEQALARCPVCRGGSPWDGGNVTWKRVSK